MYQETRTGTNKFILGGMPQPPDLLLCSWGLPPVFGEQPQSGGSEGRDHPELTGGGVGWRGSSQESVVGASSLNQQFAAGSRAHLEPCRRQGAHLLAGDTLQQLDRLRPEDAPQARDDRIYGPRDAANRAPPGPAAASRRDFPVRFCFVLV
jgi:hypothetical protein